MLASDIRSGLEQNAPENIEGKQHGRDSLGNHGLLPSEMG